MSAVVKENPEQRFVLMVAYSPNRMPARGADGRIDVVAPDVLEKAAWKFAENGFKVGLFHEAGHDGAAQVVENFVHRGKPMRFTAPDGSVQTVRKGDWLVGMILSPKAWELYKKGLIGGVSPQGTAGRKPATARTLARIKES